jgi:hypothetical protein
MAADWASSPGGQRWQAIGADPDPAWAQHQGWMGAVPDIQAGLAAARWNHDDTGASPEADWQAVTDPEASGHSAARA